MTTVSFAAAPSDGRTLRSSCSRATSTPCRSTGALAPGADGDAIVGRGAADMKGALAVMLEAASPARGRPGASDLDVGLLFFGREELPITESALLPAVRPMRRDCGESTSRS